MRDKRMILPALLLLVALLAFLIQDFIRELFLYPLVYLYWSLRLVYEGIPGVVWWGIVITLLILLALSSLSRKEKRARGAVEYGGHSLSRPQTWMHRLKKTKHGEYFKWQLAREVSQLALESLANKERLTLEQARESLAAGRLKLPPHIQAYLAAGALSNSFGHYSQIEANLRVPGTRSPIDLDPEDIVSFLESKLEGPN
jgi:hypothetical protein